MNYLVQARQEELGILLVGADFVAAAAKAATYVLSIILVVGTKKSGRVTSPIQVRIQHSDHRQMITVFLQPIPEE